MIRQKWCKACGNRYRGKGRTAIVVGPSGSGRARVCAACASRAILLVQSAADWRERIEAENDAENREARRRARQQRKIEQRERAVCGACGHRREEHEAHLSDDGLPTIVDTGECGGFVDVGAVPQ